jgi:poly-gamma-glutamate capsule biosynthesis protein CapA/YwtB (metallophosphatase superfamily)
MSRKLSSIAVFAILVAGNAYAATTRVGGQILDEDGHALAGAQVTVNGAVAESGRDGAFEASVGEGEIYTLKYAARGYFPVIHTYSALELSWTGDENTLRVPDVSLVEKAEGRVMMAFGGDAMMGRRFSEPYAGEPVLLREGHKEEDARALLRHVKPYLEIADFASVNLETQVMNTRPEGNAPKSYVFFTPPEAVLALRDAGVDYVTLGNNHTNDYLAEGLTSTLEALQAAGMPYSGAGLNESDALKALRTTVGPHEISMLGFVGWAGNFTPNQVAMGAAKSGAALGTEQNISATLQRERAAGRLPVIQYHGSREYTDEPTLVTETRLKHAIDEGAVLAIGHHPHVVQGFEIYNGRLIAYSMGNFIFDQFHYATMYTYMIYVWMDGGNFHRAEVVPLHIQGYTPMPATDTVRQKVLRRTQELSARRGVRPGRSGGNAVIFADQQPEPAARVLAVDDRDGIESLHGRPWNATVNEIVTGPDSAVRLRLGENMLPTGHLEAHYLHGSPDRGWIEDGSQKVVIVADAPSGDKVMQLVIAAGGEAGRVGMRTFEYTFEPGTPSTFATQMRASGPATVTAYQQWRGRGDNRQEALAGNRLRPIGQARVNGGGWQHLRFDFNSPRVSAISYRVLLEVVPQDGGSEHISWFDDFALIEWLTTPLPAGDLPPQVSVEQASHLDIIRD